MQRTTESKKPSPDKSVVWNWIMVPALFMFICGSFMFGGAGMAFASYLQETAATSVKFVAGCAFFGAGFLGMLTTAVKSWSFDKTGETKSTRDTPVFYEATNEAKPITGNAAVIVSHAPVRVEFNRRAYEWSKEQLNRAEDRIEYKNWAVARDHLGIATKEYPTVKYIMTGLGYWEMENNKLEWSEDGLKWHEDAMRKVAPH